MISGVRINSQLLTFVNSSKAKHLHDKDSPASTLHDKDSPASTLFMFDVWGDIRTYQNHVRL